MSEKITEKRFSTIGRTLKTYIEINNENYSSEVTKFNNYPNVNTYMYIKKKNPLTCSIPTRKSLIVEFEKIKNLIYKEIYIRGFGL